MSPQSWLSRLVRWGGQGFQAGGAHQRTRDATDHNCQNATASPSSQLGFSPGGDLEICSKEPSYQATSTLSGASVLRISSSRRGDGGCNTSTVTLRAGRSTWIPQGVTPIDCSLAATAWCTWNGDASPGRGQSRLARGLRGTKKAHDPEDEEHQERNGDQKYQQHDENLLWTQADHEPVYHSPRLTSGTVLGPSIRQGRAWPGRATDPITSPLARRCPGARVAGGHRGATRSALAAGRRRANPRPSGRRLGGSSGREWVRAAPVSSMQDVTDL